MIEALTAYTRDKWIDWNGSTPGEITIALGSGGPAHRTRAACFVFEGRNPRPSLVMKIAFASQEADFLGQEYDALTTVKPLLPHEMGPTVPEALGLAVVEENTVMTMRALPGKRLLVPDLTGSGKVTGRNSMRRFYRESFAWSRKLGQSTSASVSSDSAELAAIVDRFLAMASPSPASAVSIRNFGQAVAATDIEWSPCWQHCDLAVGNVLVDRGTIRFLDWEHAGRDSQPWFDTAQSVGATARLAKRQSGAANSRDAAIAALGGSRWAGEILRTELEGAWSHPLPLGWGVALTSMATALRQDEDERMGAEDWTAFTLALFNDEELRGHLSWAAPEW